MACIHDLLTGSTGVDRRAARSDVRNVVIYHAHDCHLCERALSAVRSLRSELEFSLSEVDITGDEELERRYRELIPVVEIDGAQAFTYYVHPEAFRRRLHAQTGR